MPNFIPLPSAELIEVANGLREPSPRALDSIAQELFQHNVTAAQAMARELIGLRGPECIAQ